MSFVRSGDIVHCFELRPAKAGCERLPTLLLIHSLGTNQSVWDGVVKALRFPGAILRYDLRGHGLTELGPDADGLAALAQDALGLLAALRVGAVVPCGISLGGLVAQELMLAAPERVRAAILCSTSARIGTPASWRERIEMVRSGGVSSVTESALTRWFAPLFRARAPDVVRGYRCMLERTPRQGYLAAMHALAGGDLSARLPSVRAPVLVVTGELDESTPPEQGRELAGLIPGARFELLLATSHIACVEKPRQLARSIDAFIEGSSEEP